MKKSDILEAVSPVIAALEKYSIPYYVGGSVASSLYGIARATLDVDLVARIAREHVSLLVDSLKENYYIDEGMISDAITRRSSFNLIHLDTMIKIDVFVLKNDLYEQEAFSRKRIDTIDDNRDQDKFYFSSAEDIILNKLQWYVLGNRVSERQWLDVIGVIKVQAGALDRDYLKTWAQKLGLLDHLQSAFSDAGLDFDE